MPIKIYIGELQKSIPPVFALHNYFKIDKKPSNLWNLFGNSKLNFEFLNVVDDPAKADFILIPHNYFLLKKMGQDAKKIYINESAKLAAKYGKKVIIFAIGDTDEEIDVPSSFIILRTSQYGYKMKPNEIIMPAYVTPHDPNALQEYRKNLWSEIKIRNKQNKPTVSFCGWAGFPNIYRYITYSARVTIQYIKFVLGDRNALKHLSGIYFRRKAISILKNSQLVITSFILRTSTVIRSAHQGNTSLPSPELAEKEYYENIINSDFVLVPKGKGNYSLRLYEVLSLGRIPILVNTDMILPLSKEIDYEKFLISIDYRNLENIDKIVASFYNQLSNEEYSNIQRKAREVFENYLRCDRFLEITLNNLKNI